MSTVSSNEFEKIFTEQIIQNLTDNSKLYECAFQSFLAHRTIVIKFNIFDRFPSISNSSCVEGSTSPTTKLLGKEINHSERHGGNWYFSNSSGAHSSC